MIFAFFQKILPLADASGRISKRVDLAYDVVIDSGGSYAEGVHEVVQDFHDGTDALPGYGPAKVAVTVCRETFGGWRSRMQRRGGLQEMQLKPFLSAP